MPQPNSVTAVAAPLLPSAPAAPTDDLTTVLMTIVADKTGYPIGMLNPDMGLEADLGIDSIKRVEILAALQEQVPGLTIRPESLAGLQTLGEIAGRLAPAGAGV